MKFFDKKLKVGLSTFFVMVVIILEFGILDEFRFTSQTENGLTIVINNLQKNLGMNFVVMSILIFVASVAYCCFLGYKKNWAGIIGMEVIAVAPFIGMLFMYDVFFGWGTAHILPMLTLMGLHTASQGVLLAIFAAIAVLYLAGWLIFRKIRANNDAKSPW